MRPWCAVGCSRIRSRSVLPQGNYALSLVSYATIGGLASVAGGGKFANGATTGAFGYLFNEMGAYVSEGRDEAVYKYSGGLPIAPPGVDVNSSIAEARRPLITIFLFKNQVKNKVSWDYKQMSPPYEASAISTTGQLERLMGSRKTHYCEWRAGLKCRLVQVDQILVSLRISSRPISA